MQLTAIEHVDQMQDTSHAQVRAGHAQASAGTRAVIARASKGKARASKGHKGLCQTRLVG